MKRKIVHIDEEKCNGCGLCIDACHERAIELVDGRARLVSDEYCDGLGDCLPACPTGAIEIIEREAAPFDEEAVQERIKEADAPSPACSGMVGCPGTAALENSHGAEAAPAETPRLRNWPVQLALVNPDSGFLSGAHLLVAADCTAFSYPGLQQEFGEDRVLLVGCPKLDDAALYRDKLVRILETHDVASITVVRMEVPCCSGLSQLVRDSMLKAEVIVPYQEAVIGVRGELQEGGGV